MKAEGVKAEVYPAEAYLQHLAQNAEKTPRL
jgi:hypothetical protein